MAEQAASVIAHPFPTRMRDHRPAIGGTFDPRSNSLNFIRLILALLVLLSHAIAIGGFGSIVHRTKLTWAVSGTVAVYGFFGISGFLIARSASSHGFWRYLWQRFLRIFPAFWVCLMVTAGFFGLVAYLHGGGTFARYTSVPSGPFSYVVNDFVLVIHQHSIAGTPSGVGVAVPLDWNGSLWTLAYEFGCYLVLGALAVLGLLRKRMSVLVVALCLWLAEVIITAVPCLNVRFQYSSNYVPKEIITLLTIFLVGSLVYLYRDSIPDSRLLAAACGAAFALSFILPVGSGTWQWRFTSIDLFAPLLIVPCLWLATHLPLVRVGSTNDYSYGVYIYAYPVSQLLAMWGWKKWGYWPFTLMILLGTAIFAGASWWGIEKRALKLKAFDPAAVRKDLKRPDARTATASCQDVRVRADGASSDLDCLPSAPSLESTSGPASE